MRFYTKRHKHHCGIDLHAPGSAPSWKSSKEVRAGGGNNKEGVIGMERKGRRGAVGTVAALASMQPVALS